MSTPRRIDIGAIVAAVMLTACKAGPPCHDKLRVIPFNSLAADATYACEPGQRADFNFGWESQAGNYVIVTCRCPN